MPISRPVRITLFTFFATLATIFIVAAIAIARFQPVARQYTLSILRQRYHSDVEMGKLEISLFPVVRASGENLVLRFRGRKDLPPIISIRRFTIQARLIGFFRNPRRIRLLRLEGLQVHIPPHNSGLSVPGGSSAGNRNPIIFEQIVADRASLQILPKDAAKEPLDFDVSELTMRHVGRGMPMTFHARITNPKPPGFIHTDGLFGPWRGDEPGRTPVSGAYTFRNADLGVFRGIAGTLASDGKYGGMLERLEVQGTADVPNFALTSGNHPVPLHATFNASVDGVDGDTVLHPVRATLDRSSFEVSGAIERKALEKHKTIELAARSENDRIQDFLELALKGPTPLTGAIRFNSRVTIPPGDSEVLSRLQLNGSFEMQDVRFTAPAVTEKLASLSHRALGEPKLPDTERVPAQLSGRFLLRDGTLTLPDFHFDLPGARITLKGTYSLVNGDIDMQGEAKLRAMVSDMTTGIKRVLLTPLDPLFRRDGAGAVLPIKIGGTRGKPSFRLDIGRALTRK